MDELAQVLRHVRTNTTDPNLLVGLEAPDDAAVYRISDEVAIVQTVDFFTPIVDEPEAWGRIAAANALSDVYAMGARPVTALNLIGWPRSLDLSLLGRVLSGANDVCEEAGVSIVGGHSVDDPEPKFGLAVTGTVHPDAIVRKSGASPGSVLVLTKPIGSGIISSAIKEGKAPPETIERAVKTMTELNRGAAEAMVATGVNAATDVTGFGLIGHLVEMLGLALSARLSFGSIPLIEGTLDLARQGILSAGSRRNIAALAERVDSGDLDEAERAVVFDAQTSGGLLIAVAPEGRADLVRELEARSTLSAAVIGEVTEGDGSVRVTS